MSQHAPEAADERARILIVDDDEVVLATTEAVLAAACYDVTTHLGAFGASSLIARTRPDLVLLDLKMPGLSGSALASFVREQAWADDVRIVFYSSSEEEVLRAEMKQTGADGYVRKGDWAKLRAAISKALGE